MVKQQKQIERREITRMSRGFLSAATTISNSASAAAFRSNSASGIYQIDSASAHVLPALASAAHDYGSLFSASALDAISASVLPDSGSAETKTPSHQDSHEQNRTRLRAPLKAGGMFRSIPSLGKGAEENGSGIGKEFPRTSSFLLHRQYSQIAH